MRSLKPRRRRLHDEVSQDTSHSRRLLRTSHLESKTLAPTKMLYPGGNLCRNNLVGPDPCRGQGESDIVCRVFPGLRTSTAVRHHRGSQSKQLPEEKWRLADAVDPRSRSAPTVDCDVRSGGSTYDRSPDQRFIAPRYGYHENRFVRRAGNWRSLSPGMIGLIFDAIA